jgi:hypothetical protein
MWFQWSQGSRINLAGETSVNLHHKGCEVRSARCEAGRTRNLAPRTIG